MRPVRMLVRLLADPGLAAQVTDWTALLAVARAESLAGSLACRLRGADVPAAVEAQLEAIRHDSDTAQVQALWEAEMARRALSPLGIPVILLKGTAYAAAGLDAATGRLIGDLDILVPRTALADAERALLAAGWEWVKEDSYDDQYYRRWMHELPPLIHRDRDRMIDVHHTILPLTAKPKPDAEAMLDASFPLEDGLRVLAPADMIVHSAAHSFADGDLAGGLRNLWDIDRLLREFGETPRFWADLEEKALQHGVLRAVKRAGRIAHDLYATPVPDGWRSRDAADTLFTARVLARDGWGRPTRRALRFGFYVRSHWLRMPPLMLTRHLFTKWRRQRLASTRLSSA